MATEFIFGGQATDRRVACLALPACCATATAGLTVTGQGENWQAGRQQDRTEAEGALM